MLNLQTLLAQQSVNTTASFEISSLANNVWMVMNDNRIHQAIGIMCVLLTIFAIYVWYLETYENFKEKGLWPNAKDTILLLALIVLAYNTTRDTEESIFKLKNTTNNVKVPLIKVVDNDDSQLATGNQINSHLKSVSTRYLLD